MYPVIDNNITLSAESQERIKRFRKRVIFKEYLSIPVEEVMSRLKYKASASDMVSRFRSCGKYLTIDPVSGAILKANFCKSRLCPVCNYISSSILWHKINTAVESIKTENKNVQFVFMTVTVRNCDSNSLSKTIDDVMQGFRRLTNRRTWKDRTLGVLRGLEITYSPKTNTYHPHIHMLVAVNNEYFNKKSDKYIDIETLRKWWSESARLDYHVQVDIRKVDNTDKAIAEVAKYSVKMAEILTAGSDDKAIEATYTLHQCIYGRRLKANTGVFKKAFRELKLGDIDDFDIETGREHEVGVDLIFNDCEADYKIGGSQNVKVDR